MAGVGGGNPFVEHKFDEFLAGIVGVEGTQMRLDGIGFFQLVLVMILVENAGQPYYGMSVDESRGDHRGLLYLITGRNLNIGSGSYGLYFFDFNQYHTNSYFIFMPHITV